MGIAFSKIERMLELGLLKGNMSIMDIGTSNLYSASTEQILGLWNTFGGTPDERLAGEMAEGSYFDPVMGGRNGAWVGELFERCGFIYESLDIAKGYRTTIFDLNIGSVPPIWHTAFDLVLNFGTTEHVLNQENAFRVIHDLVKVDAFIIHELPVGGHLDHGYVAYTLRFFMDLARNNSYEIFWYTLQRGGVKDCLQLVRGETLWNRRFFPCLSELEPVLVQEQSLFVVFRKKEDIPYRTCLEVRTSVSI